ncbi:hypothetical protein HDV00_011806 [Rhizophlyctis rosea]|nr:hypothetical protein HDV00_011806 [Rhizophlyctis rosea]
MAWSELIMWLVVPWAIGQVRKYFSKKEKLRPPKPRSSWDVYSTYFLLIIALTQLWLCLRPLPNFLAELGAGPNTPSFQLRNSFRDYMTQRYPDWTEGSSSESLTANPEVQSLEETYNLLRNTEMRQVYLRYGHKAFTACSWCTEKEDYAIYSVPSIALSYAGLSAALGVASSSPRKSHWRQYAVIGVILMGVVDAFAIYLDANTNFTSPTGLAKSRYNDAYRIRHGLFAILCLVGAAWENGEWSEGEILNEMGMKNRAMVHRGQALRLARAATLMDSGLRKKFLEFYKEQEAGREAMYEDAEFKEIRQQSMKRFDIDALVQNVREMTGGIMNTAVQEGALKGVELPPPDLEDTGSSASEGADLAEGMNAGADTGASFTSAGGRRRGSVQVTTAGAQGQQANGTGAGPDISWVDVGSPNKKKLRPRKGK